MEIVQEIGAYAGLAAVVGLAVLSALYFSQARDVRRLREWAGRAPERTPDAASPQTPRVTPQPRRTGPIRPGQPARPGQAPATPAQTGAKPASAVGGAAAAGGAAAGAAAGAGAAGPSSPAARSAAGGTEAPPAGPRADEAGTDQEEELESPAAAHNDDATEIVRPPREDGPAEGAPGEEDEPLEDGDVGAEGEKDEDLARAPSNGAPDSERPSPPVPPVAPASPPTLPPRPASRLPARSAPPSRAAGGHTEVIPPSERRAPWYRRDPRLAVLAVAGVLIVGGAAVFGLTKIGDSGSEERASQSADNGSDNGSDSSSRRRSAAVSPSSVTVSVLNGTNIPGLAAQIGDEVEAKGFQLGNVTNASDQGVRNESVVFFARGGEREAIAVGRALDISQREGIDTRTQSLAGDARVVVVAGSDKTR
ncbi:MAG TPA: LytR C-terminal domain-containing protein [Thermoleophilaceae bacterium]|nr:LytR C-terminal domain-containing protein [Thermoleophilaceae bacterium]